MRKRPVFKPSKEVAADLRLLNASEIEGIFAGGGFSQAFFSTRCGRRRSDPGMWRVVFDQVAGDGVPLARQDLLPGDAVLMSLRLPDRMGVVSALAEVKPGRLDFVAMGAQGREKLNRWIAASA